MGNISSLSSDHLDEPHSTPDLKIVLDLAKPVNSQVKQLMHWSLEEIRNIYAPFRKRKSSPLLTRSEFLRFLRLSRISAFNIYDCLTENGTSAGK